MEEDIKILEERVTTLKRHIKNYEESDCKTNVYQQLVKECNATENLLTRYKQLEEKKERIIIEKAEALQEVRKYKAKVKDSIPKSKIKEKIEELNQEEKDLQDSISDEEREEYSDANISYSLMDIETRRSVLEELLKEDK